MLDSLECSEVYTDNITINDKMKHFYVPFYVGPSIENNKRSTGRLIVVANNVVLPQTMREYNTHCSN